MNDCQLFTSSMAAHSCKKPETPQSLHYVAWTQVYDCTVQVFKKPFSTRSQIRKNQLQLFTQQKQLQQQTAAVIYSSMKTQELELQQKKWLLSLSNLNRKHAIVQSSANFTITLTTISQLPNKRLRGNLNLFI